jgi:hypothetical protein
VVGAHFVTIRVFLRIGLMCGAGDARKLVIFVHVLDTRDVSPTSQLLKNVTAPYACGSA